MKSKLKKRLCVLLVACSLALSACSSEQEGVDPTVSSDKLLAAAFRQLSSGEAVVEVGSYVTPSEDDFLWERVSGGVTILSYTGDAATIQIPSQLGGETVAAISEDAFAQSALIGVQIPDTVQSIGSSAFFYCTSLLEVHLGAGVRVIESDAFQGCIALRTVELNEGLEEIGERAFATTTALKEISLPSTLTAIRSAAFSMSGLTQVSIPGNVQSVAERAFIGCAALKTVIFGDGVENICNNAFELCSGLSQITIPATVSELGRNAFPDSPDAAILAPAGSVAETYAADYGFQFQKSTD